MYHSLLHLPTSSELATRLSTKHTFPANPRSCKLPRTARLRASINAFRSHSGNQHQDVFMNRRQCLAILVLTFQLKPAAALDADTIQEIQAKLPKAYKENIRLVVKTLRDAIQKEADGATEYEVRRAADPAKENVREFVKRWRDDPRVSSHPSHQEICDALRQLGAFYASKGARTPLADDVRDQVLAHLNEAERLLFSMDDRNLFSLV